MIEIKQFYAFYDKNLSLFKINRIHFNSREQNILVGNNIFLLFMSLLKNGCMWSGIHCYLVKIKKKQLENA